MTTKKVKCDRCKELTSLKTRIENIAEMRARDVQLGGYNLEYIDISTNEILRKYADVLAMPCQCRLAQQLPLGNTGVKISAFSEGIAQKAAKIS